MCNFGVKSAYLPLGHVDFKFPEQSDLEGKEGEREVAILQEKRWREMLQKTLNPKCRQKRLPKP